MKKNLIYVNTDTASAFEAIEGNIIDRVEDEDATVESVTITTFKQIENVKVGRNVYFEDGSAFLSGEYVFGIDSDDKREGQPEEDETISFEGVDMSAISRCEAARILQGMNLHCILPVENEQGQQQGLSFIFQTNKEECLNKFRSFHVLNDGTCRITEEY